MTDVLQQTFEMSMDTASSFLENCALMLRLSPFDGFEIAQTTTEHKLRWLGCMHMTAGIGNRNSTEDRAAILAMINMFLAKRVLLEDWRVMAENNFVMMNRLAESLEMTLGEWRTFIQSNEQMSKQLFLKTLAMEREIREEFLAKGSAPVWSFASNRNNMKSARQFGLDVTNYEMQGAWHE